jgi:hypothetical protein
MNLRGQILRDLTELALERAREAEATDLERISNEASARGAGRSGWLVRKRHECRLVTLKTALAERIRRERERALAPEDEAGWDQLLVVNINEIVDREAGRLYAEIERDWERSLGGRVGPGPAEFLVQARGEVEALRAQHIREAEIMVGERLHAERVPGSQAGVTLNINQSQVANLNLGHVVGNLQASLSNLRATGQEEIAGALKAIAEAIAKEDTLQDAEKREAVELVSAMGEEFRRPGDERRAGLLRTLGARLSQLVSGAAKAYGAYQLLKAAAKPLGYDLP